MITVEQLVIPASVDDDDAADFIADVDIHAKAEAEKYGHDELRLTPAEVLPWWQDAAAPRMLFGVKIDGQLVGRAMYKWLVSDPLTCWVAVDVVPAFRNRGIGSALLERLEQLARAGGSSAILVDDALDRPRVFDRFEASARGIRAHSRVEVGHLLEPLRGSRVHPVVHPVVGGWVDRHLDR